MKRTGKHVQTALTTLEVANLTAPGRHADGNGLYLEVEPTGAKRWTLRVVRRVADGQGRVTKGTRHDIGLGPVELVTLAEAREKARALRLAAMEGQDVMALARAGRTAAAVIEPKGPTFRMVAEQYHTANKANWKNPKHAAQWLNTLTAYAFPVIGDMPVADVDQPHCLRVLSPIWLGKPETARRVRQRLRTVFDWAKTHGHRTGDNPIGGIEHGLPRQKDKVAHHVALDIDKLPGFMKALRAHNAEPETKLSLEWLILCAARQNEVRFAQWSDIDLKARTWTIPAARMKADVDHVVPLSDRCLAILAEATALGGDEGLLFKGEKGKAMSENTHANLAKSVSGDDAITAHGFRSTFRDWVSERTGFPSDVAEAALAHAVKNDVEAAYRRGKLLEKRREMMAAWASFAAPVEFGGNITRLTRA